MDAGLRAVDFPIGRNGLFHLPLILEPHAAKNVEHGPLLMGESRLGWSLAQGEQLVALRLAKVDPSQPHGRLPGLGSLPGNHVLEHIPDDRKAMSELRRVLKPGGVAILQVPISANSATTIEDPEITDPDAREQAFGQFDHVRIYGQDYTTRLAEAGFQVDKVDVTDQYAKFGVNPEEALFVCTK